MIWLLSRNIFLLVQNKNLTVSGDFDALSGADWLFAFEKF
jgi:hypothetical protein